MPDESAIVEEIAGRIIERLRKEGFAQGEINQFGYVSDDGNGIIVSRENGQDTPISREEIAKAAQAVRNHPAIYNGTVTNFGEVLREGYSVNRRIYSPLFALVHLVALEDFNS